MTEQHSGKMHGILLMALFACAAFYISETQLMTTLNISAMIIGIVLGMIYANTLRNHLPEVWTPGIVFCSKKLLRLGIILYGFRLTLQDVAAVGVAGITVDAIIVCGTIFIGVWIGKLLKMDKDITLLTSIGSAICGAAAVLGAEAALNTKPYKTAVAVATVVIFGTLSMFIYPVLYASGVFALTPNEMGIFGGSTLHEVAHAVGAGEAMGPEISKVTVIVKMIRVMMLVVVLLVLSVWVARANSRTAESKAGKVSVPWFALWFLGVILLNSLLHSIIPESADWFYSSVIPSITYIDTFLLTMAMAALGAETSFEKFKKAGAKPFLLALCLYVWLIGGGYCFAKYLVPALM